MSDQLKKLILKSGDNNINIGQDSLDYGENELSLTETDTLVERYIKKQVCLHLHIRFKSLQHDLGDLCLIFESYKGIPFNIVGDGTIQRHGATDWLFDHERNELVLITNVEAVKQPQEVAMRVPALIPTTIRLHFLDDCLSFMWQAPDSTFFAGFKGMLSVTDREHGVGIEGISASKLPGDIVKSASEIVNTVTKRKAPISLWDLQRFAESYNIATVFLVWFDEERIRIRRQKELSHLVFESVEMLLCPTSFGSAAAQTLVRSRHEALAIGKSSQQVG